MARTTILLVMQIIFFSFFQTGSGQKPRIYSLHITSDIQFRFATTLVTSRVTNPSPEAQDATFDVILPDEAFITDFKMEIDGEIYPGQIDEKKKADKKYQKAKSKGQSAGRVSQRPRSTNKFAVEVNIASLSKVTFNLTYQELLKRKHASYQHVVYINPNQAVDDFKVDVYIQESRDIQSIFVPEIQQELLNIEQETTLSAVASIQRPNSRTAHISYHPSQEEQPESGIDGMFVVRYDIQRDSGVGDVHLGNGYFVHFFAPSGMETLPKDVLFVLDTSGSMSGTKIRQMIEAMEVILEDLHEEDRYNILEFDSNSKLLIPGELVPVRTFNMSRAQKIVRKMRASGGTNISGAMTFGLQFLNRLENEDDRIKLLIFLTDGHGNSGSSHILSIVKSANHDRIPIYSLAFGNGADYKFIKTVAVQNNGLSRHIYEHADAAEQIKGFYDEISRAALKNLTISYQSGDGDIGNLTQSQFNTFFKDSEIVVAGRLPDPQNRMLDIDVKGKGAEGLINLETNTYISNYSRINFPGLTLTTDFEEITEKIWAYVSIKQLLEKTLGDVDKESKIRFREEALKLALQYKFVTPLTSMVVTKPDEEELGDLQEGRDADLIRDASGGRSGGLNYPSSRLQSGSGYSGGGHSYSGGGGGDPHFMIRVDGLSHPVCFDIINKEGDIMKILTDPIAGISINAEIIHGINEKKHGGWRTFIGRVFVITRHFTLDVTPSDWLMNHNSLSWEDGQEFLMVGGCRITVIGNEFNQRILRLEIGYDITIDIRRVLMVSATQADYLNVYIEKEDGLSPAVDGVLGQFHRKQISLKSSFTNVTGHVIGQLLVKDGKAESIVETKLHDRRDVITEHPEKCWNAHTNTEGLLTEPIFSDNLNDF